MVCVVLQLCAHLYSHGELESLYCMGVCTALHHSTQSLTTLLSNYSCETGPSFCCQLSSKVAIVFREHI